MTNKVGRRALAAGAGLLPVAMIGSAHAQAPSESALDRIRRTKTLRIAALPGELPYFQKDITSGAWGGACIEMANSIAKVLGAKLAYIEATYGTSVLDLQTDKVDL
ncbi:MAG: ABC transporter substrate-binding protein, partial [Acetobacteraceae bacterium]